MQSSNDLSLSQLFYLSKTITITADSGVSLSDRENVFDPLIRDHGKLSGVTKLQTSEPWPIDKVPV